MKIQEAKLRNAIWYLKTGKTKKFVCEYIGIDYNIKKLNSLLDDFAKSQAKNQELREKNKKRQLTEAEKTSIIADYVEGASQQAIADKYFITTYRVKKLIIESNIPLRSTKGIKIDHIKNTDEKLSVGMQVVHLPTNSNVVVDSVYDEEYLDLLEQGKQRYVELYPIKKAKNPIYGVHYELYWDLANGDSFKLSAVESIRKQVLRNLESYGSEYYRVWRVDDDKCYIYAQRKDLLYIKAAK